MSTHVSILEDNSVFRRNLEAVSLRQPKLAGRLRRVKPALGVRIVSGRDGSPVVQLSTSAETVVWLGESSIPTVSAPAALAGYVDKATSVVLTSVGTGYEPRMLAERIPAHCAVFVCEAEPAKIALALAAVDWSDLLDTGRIVIIDGSIEESLAAFLVEHPGYELPSQLYPLGSINRAEVAERTAAVERAAQRVAAALESPRVELERQLAGWSPAVNSSAPRLLTLSVDAAGGAVDFSAQIERARRALGWEGESCVPDSPERCSRFARLRAIHRSEPSLILMLNCTPGPLRQMIPASVVRASWFLESGVLPGRALEDLGENDNLFAASTQVRDVLVARGARPATVSVLEVGVDQEVFRPLDGAEAARTQDAGPVPGDRVSILCDGQDLSASACNIGLESHQRLWRRMKELTSAASAKGGEPGTEDLVRAAERSSGVELADPEFRDHFVALANHRLVRTIPAKQVAEALAEMPGVALWGRNWQVHETARKIHRGAIPSAEVRNVIFNTADLVILPFADAIAFQFAREALAAGCCPLLREPGDSLLAQYPQTCEILSAVPTFRGAADVFDCVERLLADKSGRSRITQSLRVKLLDEHTVRHRIEEIRRR